MIDVLYCVDSTFTHDVLLPIYTNDQRTNDIPILLPRKLFVRNDTWTSLPRPQKPGYKERPSRELEGLIEGMIVLDDDRDLDCN